MATNPEYDGSAGEETKKRRFVVLEILYPCLTKEIRIAALGGHSKEVFAPPGHYLLGKESIRQLAPLTHHTSATKDITQAGFLSQQDRKGGGNLSTGENVYRPRATHKIEVNTPWNMDSASLGTDFPMLYLPWGSGKEIVGMERSP